MLERWGLTRQPQECIWVVCHDSSLNIRTVIEIARGTPTSTDLHIPSLLAAVLTAGTDRFVMVHNHPGNDPRPTDADVDTTFLILEAANACGLYLEDHLIVTPKGDMTSLAALGVFKPATPETILAVAGG